MKVLVTGAAGFIGFHVSKALLGRGDEVVGLDNFNDYYLPELKRRRYSMLTESSGFVPVELDLCDADKVRDLVSIERPDKICHLAAQAGVRYSLERPQAYIDANMTGFVSVVEAARHEGVSDVVYASSSSVYGANTKVPFSEDDAVDRPISLYAASKRANELMAHTYNHLFGLHMTGLRFFTVYGPWGRPDMALYKFADAMLKDESFPVYNGGDMLRDFTYIDDIVRGVVAAIDRPFENEVFNLAAGDPVKLMTFIDLIEKELGVTAKRNLMPMQLGDVRETVGDIEKANRMLDYNPQVDVEEGIARFCDWFREWRT